MSQFVKKSKLEPVNLSSFNAHLSTLSASLEKTLHTNTRDSFFSFLNFGVGSFFIGVVNNYGKVVKEIKKSTYIYLSDSFSPIENAIQKIMVASKTEIRLNNLTNLERELTQQKAHFEATMSTITDAVITTDLDGYVQYMNRAAELLTGWLLIDALGKPISEIFQVLDGKSKKDKFNSTQSCVSNRTSNDLKHQTKFADRNGNEHDIEQSVSSIQNLDGEISGKVYVFHNVTQQRLMADEILFKTRHDSLTGLLNRSEFESQINQCLLRNRASDLDQALLYIDLDRFKVINDTCGHDAGDLVLKDVAKIIQTCTRNTDVLARMVGDEFAVILHKCDGQQSLKVAKNIIKAIGEYQFHHVGEDFHIGACIGLVAMNGKWKSSNDLLKAVENSCLEAKNTGRHRVYVHVDEVINAQLNETKWVSRIEKAIEEKRFVLFCQRIMPLNHLGLEHAEILIRMVDQDGQLIKPSAFLPAAECFHLASRIDRYVVQKVLNWMALNKDSINHIESISINLSGQSLSDLTFHQDVLDWIGSASIETNKLCFEITETAAITNIADAKKFISALSVYGVKFSLDDFGSGVSSFGYLKNLNVDYLKIDGQFIKDLLKNDVGQATVRCIAEVAKVTGKKTIAEWVEDKTVEKMLRKMGIDFTQGYLKHNPAPLDYLLELNCNYQEAKDAYLLSQSNI